MLKEEEDSLVPVGNRLASVIPVTFFRSEFVWEKNLADKNLVALLSHSLIYLA